MEQREYDAMMAQYPTPQPWSRHTVDDADAYCVGGLLCLWQGCAVRYPSVATLAEQLRRANPRLTAHRARQFARCILDDNDYDRMARAHETLRAALALS